MCVRARALTWRSSLEADLRAPGQVEQPALAVDLPPGAADLLLVERDGPGEQQENVLGRWRISSRSVSV